MKLFFKKVSGFSRQSLESLSAESETPFCLIKAQEWVNFRPFYDRKEGEPSPGVLPE